MSTLSILPAHYDVAFIIAQAGVTNHYGYEAKEDGIHFRYQASDYDAVTAARLAYPVAHLAIELPTKLRQASWIRDTKIAGFAFNDISIPLDAETRSNLTGAALGLERNPDLESMEWSLGDGEFITIPRDEMLAMADAAFLHVQKAFAAHRIIADEIKAAADIDELAAIDVANHPAWDA